MSLVPLKDQLIMNAWIARDKDGALYMYKVKPYRGKSDYEDCWYRTEIPSLWIIPCSGQ